MPGQLILYSALNDASGAATSFTFTSTFTAKSAEAIPDVHNELFISSCASEKVATLFSEKDFRNRTGG